MAPRLANAQSSAEPPPTGRRSGVLRASRPLLSALMHLSPERAIPLAFALVAVTGVADYLTGYEVHLAILYLLPIVLATWNCGRGWGLLMSILGPAIWAASISTQHKYSSGLLYLWDSLVMTVTFVLFVELLSQLKRALESSDERFLRVLDGLHAAVCVIDRENHLLYANRRLMQQFGDRPETLRDAHIAAGLEDGKPVGSRADEAAAAAFVATEFRDPRDGRWYLRQSSSVPWVSGRNVTLAVMTDITEQKLSQSLRQERQESLHHTARLVSLAEAASTLSHELNQPLVAIVGYTSACARLLDAAEPDRPALSEAMRKCGEQATRAGAIIRRMTELTRRRSPQLAACDLNLTIRQTLVWAESELERAGVRADLRLAGDLGLVWADRILVEQVMLNLVQNAIDAMRDAPHADRTMRIASHRAGAGAVQVSVADRGCGISRAIAERLYTPFFTTKASGLGLGLGICRSVVEMHGGRLWHTDAEGGGSVFHFVLPENAP